MGSASSPSRKRPWPFIAALLLILASLPLSWWFFYGQEPAAKVEAAAPVDAGTKKFSEIRVAEVTGTVLVKRGDAGFVSISAKDKLLASDAVRTEDGSYAVLVGDEYWEVKMEPGTEVSVGELDNSITSLLLQTGMARAKVKGSSRHVFEVRATGTDAVARTSDGTFAVSHNGQGTVAVGTEAGEVTFVGKGKVVIVRAGQQAIVKPGEAPSDPTPIPNSLLLKVALPAATTLNKPKLVLVGHVEPGARVDVQGQVVSVDDHGRFEWPTTLKEGKNTLEVHAQSVGRLSATSTHQLELDTTVRKTTIDKNLWEGTTQP
ncbi:MAG: FecR domain-containing protein [Myxococcaceae bacterium]|nr:FecR domain-containing protein [Myxococcaceae bacterium]